ncbi:MAG: hypothetical protein IJ507_07380 [Clostridia bacterium]|nr:hypothetical protein [Clostridia bacterium]
MSQKIRNILLTILSAALLIGFAAAIPSPVISDEALDAYWAEAAEDDEYAFLFDD